MCENFLTRYRTMMGPVNDVRYKCSYCCNLQSVLSELRAAGSQDLLSIRFGILKGVRDDETKKATALWQQLTAVKKDEKEM